MLTELHGKGGRICRSALEGKLRCPLIVRPTSEDVITGHLAQVLRVLNPRWWLPDLLNLALGESRLHRQVFRRLKIEPWKNRPRYPRELLPWEEGSTQVDLVFSWENPPTTVYVEMKYGSDLSFTTAGNNGRSGFPSDQLIRNARVGLLECGWFNAGSLFDLPPRDFVLILCSPAKGHCLVKKYRDPKSLLRAIPHSDRLQGLPAAPFVGELSYNDIVEVFRHQRRWFTRAEQRLLDSFVDYLAFKRSTVPNRESSQQRRIDFSGGEMDGMENPPS
jgi:hypothetical protein